MCEQRKHLTWLLAGMVGLVGWWGVQTAGWAQRSGEIEVRERQLAGMRLGNFALEILRVRMYGTPHRITRPGQEAAAPQAAPAGAPGGEFGEMPGMPGMAPGAQMPGFPGAPPGAPYGSMGSGGMMPLAGMGEEGELGGGMEEMELPGGMPEMMEEMGGMPPGGVPMAGMGGLPGMPGMPGAGPPGAPTVKPTEGEPGDVVWVYEFEPDISVEFTIDVDGIIKSISVIGSKWNGARTAKGIQLGDTFKQVLLAYGYPDEIEPLGDDTIVYYRETNNIAFAFRNMKVTTIVITLPE